jgi:mRNA interferase MazF
MKEGEIVLANLFTSFGNIKKRPALILKILPKYGDLLLCGISTKIHQMIYDFDYLIMENDNDFKSSGLIKDSIIRLSYITVIPRKYIEGNLGFISSETYKLIINRLCNYLKN